MIDATFPSPISQNKPINNTVVPSVPPVDVASTISNTSPSNKQERPPIKKIYMYIGALLFLGIFTSAVLYFRNNTQPVQEPIATVTPTIVPTPTPLPNLSRISSTSAFMTFSDEIASFSSMLNTFTLQDGTLTPPILDAGLEINN